MPLPAQDPTYVEGHRTEPVTLTIYPAGSEIPGLHGMVSSVATPDGDLWQLISARDHCTRWSVARLLATLVVNAALTQAPLLWPSFMPPRPPLGVLRDGQPICQSRGLPVPDWAEAEISRVAAVLLREHGGYMEALFSAARGARPPGFRQTPSHFWIYDAHGHMLIAPAPPRPRVDVSGSPEGRGLRGYHIITEEYRRLPYLRHLSREGLARRLADIFANIHVLDEAGRISVDPNDLVGRYWFARVSEVVTEMQSRYGPYPAGWDDGIIRRMPLPGSLDPASVRIVGELCTTRPIRDRHIVKYGERRFLEPMLRTGSIRVSPAAAYADPSLNPAIHDDELTLTLDINELTAGPYAALLRRSHRLHAGGGSRADITLRAHTNYYVYCVAHHVSARLIQDFGGDCCVVVHEPDEFVRRLRRAMERMTLGWSVVYRDVEYYDPVQTNVMEVSVLYSKHFRYAYQHETRVAWVPPHSVHKLEPVYVELGPLHDIAEIVLAVPTSLGG